MIKYIAIILGDNDFVDTFVNLLDTVFRVLLYRDDLSQEYLTECIMGEALEFHYRAFQVDPELSNNCSVKQAMHYLRINMRILYNEDACKVPGSDEHGSWFLDVATGQVNSF